MTVVRVWRASEAACHSESGCSMASENVRKSARNQARLVMRAPARYWAGDV
jgi:hypothetical protein